MSAVTTLENVGNDVKGFFAKFAVDAQKAKAVWTALSSPQTRAVLIKLGTDAITLCKDADAAAIAGGLSLALDGATVNDIKQLVIDAKSADPVIAADLAILGIKV
jgi:hypothetical protein